MYYHISYVKIFQMRNPKRNTAKASWTEEDLKRAKKARAEGKPIREVARLYNIPVTTLYDRLKSGSTDTPNLGRKPVFSKHQEEDMAHHVVSLAKAFYGISPNELKRLAFEFAEKNGIPNNFNRAKCVAGDDWLAGFLKRNPSVSVRKPEATSLNRITGFNKIEVDKFFSNLSQLMDKHNFPPSRIFNMGESGLSCVQKPGTKGEKQVGAATSAERGRTITICCAVNAVGTYVPPMMIFPALRLKAEFGRGGPEGTAYACSESGWMTEELFYAWLQHFTSSVGVSKSNPVLLVLDNHSSHISLSSYNFCRENGVYLLSLPPHSSHRLQPLDVTFHGPLKTAFNKECDVHMREYSKIIMSDVPIIFKRAFIKVAKVEKGVSGFRTTGIYPLNPGIFSEEDFLGASARTVDENEIPEDGINSEEEIRVEDEENVSNTVSEDQDTSQKGIGHVSFAEISPIPGPSSKVGHRNSAAAGRKKQHSEHLTGTPMKETAF